MNDLRTTATALRTRWGKRVKTPTVLQMEAVECGAAALGIVLGHYGCYIPLEELRVACGVSRGGSVARNIMQAARQYGCEARGYKRSIEKLRAKSAELPMILFWNFNHFVVLEGFRGDRVFINDPGTGPRNISYDEFDSSFTGVTLVIRPTEKFDTQSKPPSIWATLRQRLQGTEKTLAFLLVASLLLTLVQLVVPSFTRIFIDRYLVAGLLGWRLPLLAAIGATVLLLGVLTWLLFSYLLRFEMQLAISSSSRFFWHVIRLPLNFFMQRRSSDIAARVGLNDQIANLLAGNAATNAINLLLILFYAVVMWRYDPLLTLVGIGFAVLNFVALRTIGRYRSDANQRTLNEQGKLISVAFSGLQMIETLKATGREADFFTRWSGTQANVTNAEQELGLSSELLGIIPIGLMTLNSSVILLLGGVRIIEGTLTFGELVAFQALVAAFMLPIMQFVNLGGRLQKAYGEMVRMDDVMKYPLDPQAPGSAETTPDQIGTTAKLAGHIELRGVTFGYSKLTPPLVSDFNLTLRPGARIALVGGSGSGKSTVAKLIAGIYQPWSGDILLEGKPMIQIPRAQLKTSLSFVDQEIYLFEGSGRDNLTLWNRTITEAAIVQAAKDAVIHDTLNDRTGGYDATISEGGRNLSGGQRQRMEIARALVNDPTILVLDEATSALDPVTEKQIDENLRRRGCTCLIVAHRLSTIRDCDEIIVMAQGKVVQRGTHEQLIRQRGAYTDLIRSGDSTHTDMNVLMDLLQADAL